MVLVLAALYTCYNNYHHHHNNNANNNNPKKDAHSNGNEEADDTSATHLAESESESLGGSGASSGRWTATTTASPLIMAGPVVVFRSDVRDDWMAAVLGTEALDQVKPGIGFGKVASCGPYRTVGKTLPRPQRGTTHSPPPPLAQKGTPQQLSTTTNSPQSGKLGMTLSQVSYGLCVHRVIPQSEASLIGLPDGAILVRVNGMCVLAEPSELALERLWECEATSSTSGVVVLEVWHRGHLYQTAILGGAPWGIAWAPAVRMVQVTRVRGLAAQSGIPNRSWLLAIDDVPVQSLEHAGTLLDTGGDTASSEHVRLTLGFPPRGARPTDDGGEDMEQGVRDVGARERPPRSVSPAAPPIRQTFDDGVRVTFHPFDATAVAGLCHHVAAAVAPSPPPPSLLWAGVGSAGTAAVSASDARWEAFGSDENTPAAAVAAGRVVWEVPPPQQQQRRRPRGSSDGSLRGSVPSWGVAHPAVLRAWDPAESLRYCLRLHAAEYRPDKFAILAVTADAINADDGMAAEDAHGDSTQTKRRPLLPQPLPAGHTAADVVGSFLLQCLGVVCATPPPPTSTRERDGDEKKEMDGGTVQAATTAWAAQQEVTSLLLRVSRKDQGFCQRLYFLLRSFLSTLETDQPSPLSATAGPASTSNARVNTVSTTALLALLNCLERLRFAEQRHAAATANAPVRLPPLGLANFPSDSGTHLRSYHSPLRKDKWIGEPSECASPQPPSQSHPTVSPARKKGLFGRFRKKKGSSNDTNSRSTSTATPSTSTRVPMTPRTAAGPTPRPVESPRPARSLALRQQRGSPQSSPRSPTANLNAVAPTSPSVMYENLCAFLTELDDICRTIEQSLRKSFGQKMADWALQPWSPGQDSALARVSRGMREQLKDYHDRNRLSEQPLLLVNPVDGSELLSGVDWEECYILPSAHFPILLSFHVSEQRCSDALEGEERLYRTKVEVFGITATISPKGDPTVDAPAESDPSCACHFAVQAAVAGTIAATTQPSRQMRCESNGGAIHLYHLWPIGNVLTYDTRSSWGPPQTLSLRVTRRPNATRNSAGEDASATTSSGIGGCDDAHDAQELGYGWVDLSSQFSQTERHLGGVCTTTCKTEIHPVWAFDEHGEIDNDGLDSRQPIELQLKITTECVRFSDCSESDDGRISRKRMLLYKHNDDLRQEAFAVQFVKTCDSILKASGLDLKLLTFQCIPVGTRRGFVEWVPGSVPLSEVCEPFAGSFLGSSTTHSARKHLSSDVGSPSMCSKGSLNKYQSLRRLGNPLSESSRVGSGPDRVGSGVGTRGSFQNNPIQDYLRAVAYDPVAPYLIRKDVMDTYVKSCAGYSVVTYVLGVGDRHLDNLLLHQSGCFFHCDYSFILGSDPKTYMPVRITDDMVYGMGGRDSDNYARFVSMMGAAFVALRRPESVRLLLSMVRLLEHSCLPDLTEHQTLEQALQGLRDRLRLDLSNADAVAYMEGLVESALSSKVALAVDAIHSLGKKF